MSDPIEELIYKTLNKWIADRNMIGVHNLKEFLVRELHAANVTIPPQPPKPGSLWEHKRTGERRFIRRVTDSVVLSFRGGEDNDCVPIEFLKDWHTWAANAVELVPGRDA